MWVWIIPSVPITKQLKDLFFMIWCSEWSNRRWALEPTQSSCACCLPAWALKKGFSWITDAVKATLWIKKRFWISRARKLNDDSGITKRLPLAARNSWIASRWRHWLNWGKYWGSTVSNLPWKGFLVILVSFSFLLVYLFIWTVLGIKPRVLCMVSNPSIIDLHH